MKNYQKVGFSKAFDNFIVFPKTASNLQKKSANKQTS